MIWIELLKAVASLSLMGLVLGLLLAVAAKAFEIKEDDRVVKITELLPGANCAGCGYTGCSAYAKAIVEQGAGLDACAVMAGENKKKIASIMGTEAADAAPLIATVRCCGTDGAAVEKYDYDGEPDCDAAMRLAGGPKSCSYSCMGFGNCVKACAFDAISVVNGAALVDSEKCVGCGACAKECPKLLITLVPRGSKYYVGCSNKDKGGVTRQLCAAGCIGCKLCEKACDYAAITVTDNFAKIDYTKCVGCGACAEKCPKKIIRLIGEEQKNAADAQ